MYLAMLPGREIEGPILLECAVNLSEKAGYEGRTYSQDFVRHTLRAYRQPWLEHLQSDTVVPNDEPNTWVKINGEWRLKRHLLVFAELALHLRMQIFWATAATILPTNQE